MEGTAQYHTKWGMGTGRSQPTLWAIDQTGSASQQLSCWRIRQHPCQWLPVFAILGPGLEILTLELVDPEPETVVLELVLVVLGLEATKHCSYKGSDTQGMA